MSYHVNKKDLLFNDLTDAEARELEHLAYDIVIHGKTNLQHPAFLAWKQAGEYDDRQALLVYATAFPQRLLLSTTDFWRECVEEGERQSLERDCEVCEDLNA